MLTTAMLTLLASWGLFCLAGAGVVVLPWTNREVDASAKGWGAAWSYVVSLIQGIEDEKVEAAHGDLPELSWDVIGDWTTSIG
jgi:hypothetical protein